MQDRSAKAARRARGGKVKTDNSRSRDGLRPSLKLIASELGISVMTVSRALREGSEVSEQTRQRVMAVADRLRYRPNLLVRGLQTGKTRVMGVMLPAADPFYSHILSGIHDELVNFDYVPIVLWSKGEWASETAATELEQIHRLLDHRVDGVILKPVVDVVSDQYLREVWERQIPLVAVDRELPYTHADFVGTDDRTGGVLAAEYLLGRGHRRLVHLAAEGAVGTFRDRRLGFEAAAAAAGVHCEVIDFDDKPAGGDDAALRRALQRAKRATALFLAHDGMALRVYDIAAELGLRIPHDLSVLGFADLPVARSVRPGLTTVRQDAYQIGRRAARLVLDRSAGGDGSQHPQRIRLPSTLIVRGSTGPASA